MDWRIIKVDWVFILVLPVSVLLFAASEPPAKSTPTQERSAESESARDDAEPGSAPTAESMLRALRQGRPANVVIPPAGVSSMDALKSKAALWPEGSVVIDRVGTLHRSGAWWVFAWTDLPKEDPVKMLPNVTLESITRMSEVTTNRAVLVVTGEMTVFEKENYLLAATVFRGPAAVSTAEPWARQATDLQPSVATDASVDDVLKLIQQQQGPQRILPRESELPENDGVRSVWRDLAPILDGTPVVSRPGRLVRGGEGWNFVFESDHPSRPEPPMRLLPCRSLELMQKLMEQDPSGLVFVVSGEVTAFEGKNFLLVRAALRRTETGNLSK